jgi:hypothetical protein
LEEAMTQIPDGDEHGFRRDRREHAGAPDRLDQDRLAHMTEDERVAAGIEDFDPDDVPPATDVPLPADVTESGEYQDVRAEIEREAAEGELTEGDLRDRFPPTRYDDP